MSMHYNQPTHSPENDLTDIFTVIGRFFRLVLYFFFRVLDFVIRKWWVLLILIVVGVGLAYLSKGNTSYTAQLLLKTNFKSQSYVYNAIKQFDGNLLERDATFLKALEQEPSKFSITSVEIAPVVEVLDIIDFIGENDKVLGEMTREFKLEDDKELFATDRFLSTYKFHKLDITLRNDKQLEDVNVLLSYINSQPYAKELKARGLKSHKEFLESQEKSVAQIDNLINSFTEEGGSKIASSDKGFYFNNRTDNLAELFDMKTMLVHNLEEYRNDEVSYKDVAVIVSDVQASRDENLLAEWAMLLYPSILILLFLLVAGGRSSFKKYKLQK